MMQAACIHNNLTPLGMCIDNICRTKSLEFRIEKLEGWHEQWEAWQQGEALDPDLTAEEMGY